MRPASPEFVRGIVTHPEVWPWLAEDGQRPEDYQPAPSVYYRHRDLGFMQFDQAGRHWYQVHIAMLRGAREVPEFVRSCLQAMRESRGAQRFTALIPAPNRAAIVLAWRCGFVECGRLHGVVARGGIMSDMIMLEAS